MSRIDQIFRELHAAGHCGLMPFITAGHPSLDATRETLCALEDAGAHAVEIGFPYSDPIADGPVIAASMHESLAHGTTPRRIFELVRESRGRCRIAIIAMVSHSIVHQMGGVRFIREAVDAGIDGFILPDVDVAGVAPFAEAAVQAGTSLTLLLAPTTSDSRALEIVRHCTGFVYVLARVGLTGERRDLPSLERRIRALRGITPLPLAVGFGISTPDQAVAAARHADAVIVGSALVRRMGEANDPAAVAGEFIGSLARSLRQSESRNS